MFFPLPREKKFRTVSAIKNFQRQNCSLINKATFVRFGNQSTRNQVFKRRCKTVNARHAHGRITLRFNSIMWHRR